MRFRLPLPLLLAALAAVTTGLVLLIPGGAVSQEKKTPRKLKALLITGGCCHDYDNQKVIIPAGIGERYAGEIEWKVIQQGGTTTDTKIPYYEDPNWAEGFDIVVHNECFAKVDDKAFVDGILKPHKEGLPAIVVHCAMHCYRTGDDRWFEFCGVTSRRHGPKHPFNVDVVNEEAKKHPVMKDFKPWDTPQGELYYIEKVWDTATPLTHSKSEDTGDMNVNAWVNLYGEKKTRVFGTTIGHHNETMMTPQYLDTLTRGFLWAVGETEEGAFQSVSAGETLKEYKKAKEEEGLLRMGANLAQGKQAEASSEESGKKNLVGNAVDGDPKTRWCAARPGPATWWVDLKKPQRVRAVAIDWEGNAAYQYRIEGSSDGGNWETLIDASKNDVKSKVVVHEMDAKKTRFLRVEYLGSDTGGWGSFYEFAAYDDLGKVPSHLKLAAAKAGEARKESNGKSTTVKTPLFPAGKGDLLSTVLIPKGYEATIFASPPEVNYPTFVKATPSGELFVSVDKNGSLARDPDKGKIMKVIDTDGDGKADKFFDFVPSIDSPRGLEWDGEWLYVMHPPHLSAFRDTNGDNVADEERRLVSGIAFGFEDRPADHTSNGVTLGVDGWLYLAIGDFGFMDGEGADGTKLQFRGGGVVRVRRDGSGMHVFSRGTRNIYEVAVSPLLDGFTRDNTNDGGGWDVRFHHFTGLEHHGYPSLFRHFDEDIVQPLADYGGGSGTGALWLDEPGFPKSETNVPFTVDWGRNLIYRHEVERKGATFTETAQHEFIAIPRPNDLDADATGRLYVASWKDGRFKYDGENIGFVARVTPPRWKASEVPDFESKNWGELMKLLESESQLVRLHAQLALLRLKEPPVEALQSLALADAASHESRTAALFALAQIPGETTTATIVKLAGSQDSTMRGLAFRALADQPDGKNHSVLSAIKTEKDPVVVKEILVAMARTETDSGDFLIGAVERVNDPDPVVAHTAIRVLSYLEASHVCFVVLDDKQYEKLWPGAMKALSYMHRPEVVEGLITRLKETRMAGVKIYGLSALARLYYREGEWSGESWGTRPDTSGPYYKREKWEATDSIDEIIRSAVRDRRVDKPVLLAELGRNHIELDNLGELIELASGEPAVEPALVNAVLDRETIPEEAIPFLMKIAKSEQRDGELRLLAATALGRSANEDAVITAMEIMGKSSQIDAIPHVKNALRDAVFSNPSIENRYESFLRTANGSSTSKGKMAWEILFALHDRKEISPETKEEIENAINGIDRNGSPQQIRLLESIASNRFAFGLATAKKLLDSDDEKVESAAQAVVDKLSPTPTKAKGKLIGEMKPEEVLAKVSETKGKASEGEAIFANQLCVNCHTVSQSQPLKGPYLGNISSIYKGKELAEAVLLPNKTIAQGFATQVFQLKNGGSAMGFVTTEAADHIELRDIAGNVSTIKPGDIAERSKLPTSMMPPGLVNNLTVPQFASLLAYLESLKE